LPAGDTIRQSFQLDSTLSDVLTFVVDKRPMLGGSQLSLVQVCTVYAAMFEIIVTKYSCVLSGLESSILLCRFIYCHYFCVCIKLPSVRVVGVEVYAGVLLEMLSISLHTSSINHML